MDVILLERIEKLGQMGDVVSVKAGFARNYLLPQKKALRATKSNLESFESRRGQLEAASLEHRKDAESMLDKVQGLSLVLIRSAGESGQLYGSVSSRDVTGALAEAGVTVDRRQIELAGPIKSLGLHPVRVRLHPEVYAEITVNVAQSEDEAERRARAAAAPGEAEAAPAASPKAPEAEAPEAPEITEELAEEFFEQPESVTGAHAAEAAEEAEPEAAEKAKREDD